MGGRRRRKKAEPTAEWQALLPLFEWPEQERYERIRPLVLFGWPAAERAEEVGTSERTLQRRVARFREERMDSLFDSERARQKGLPPAVRRLVLDPKAEHPAFTLNEIANAVRACFGRKPDVRSVKRVFDEQTSPRTRGCPDLLVMRGPCGSKRPDRCPLGTLLTEVAIT